MYCPQQVLNQIYLCNMLPRLFSLRVGNTLNFADIPHCQRIKRYKTLNSVTTAPSVLWSNMSTLCKWIFCTNKSPVQICVSFSLNQSHDQDCIKTQNLVGGNFQGLLCDTGFWIPDLGTLVFPNSTSRASCNVKHKHYSCSTSAAVQACTKSWTVPRPICFCRVSRNSWWGPPGLRYWRYRSRKENWQRIWFVKQIHTPDFSCSLARTCLRELRRLPERPWRVFTGCKRRSAMDWSLCWIWSRWGGF